VNYAYNNAGLRTNMTVAGQAAVTYRYDNANRLTNVVQSTDNVKLFYDDAGRRTNLNLPRGIKVAYRYDTASRLTNITYYAAVTNKIDYAYDATGNRRSQVSALSTYLLPSAVSTGTYNAANQQLTFGSYNILYDSSGNVTNIVSGTTTNRLLWNARNQLTNVVAAVSGSFVYDGLGRRRQRVVSSNTENYLYDGLDVILQKTGAGAVGARYLRGLAIDEPWQRTDIGAATTNRVYLADALGSIVALADTNKVIQTEYDYEPFGTTTTTGSANKNSHKFTAREDDGTGLYYYRARFYHPATERFLSEDPLRLGTREPNFYSYVGNDPISYGDPFGLRRMYGNWGGPDWTGGQTRPYEDLTRAERSRLSPPIDSMDECFRQHDICYSVSRVICKPRPRDFDWYKGICDDNLDRCLKRLDKDPNRWPRPVPDPNWARWFRRGAQLWF
jgi:RHS repeat-associated protein